MAQSLGTTAYLALAFGIYFIAIGFGMFRRPEVVGSILASMRQNEMLTLIAGVVAFVIGATLVGLHNRWDAPLAIAVSLMGWLSLIKGIMLLAFQSGYAGMFDSLGKSTGSVRAIALAMLVVGVVLVAAAAL